jgi:protein involved in sex pheromone biosynthesis
MKKNYLLLLTAIIFSSVCTYFLVNDKEAIQNCQQQNSELAKKLDESNAIADSLNNEVFIYKTNQERYEIAIEMFKEVNPKGYNQLQYIISHKTE